MHAPTELFGFSWLVTFSLRKPQFMSVGFPWISLDFLGFSRPNLGFSMGCADFSAKKFSRRFCRSVEARNVSLRFAYGARIAHRPSLTEFRIFCNRLWSEPFPFDLNPKAASLSQLPFGRTAIVIATHRASLKPYGFLAMTIPLDRSALYALRPTAPSGRRSRPTSSAKVAATRIMVSAAPEKMSPRSVSPKMATGSVTQPGG
jgi:hypothetical protein